MRFNWGLGHLRFEIVLVIMAPRNAAAAISDLTKERLTVSELPPDGLPRYRLLTGRDDAQFCRRESDALNLGYRLYGSPKLIFDGQHVIAGQAVVWPPREEAHA